MLESIIKGINQSIDVTNIGKLSSKIQNFLTSYKNNKKNIALVTDFDFTISIIKKIYPWDLRTDSMMKVL